MQNSFQRITNYLTNNFEKLNIVILGLITIFIRIPPFYFFVKNPLFLSNFITRYLILISFFLTLLAKKIDNYRKKTLLYVLILVYFISQTLSISSAINITAFLTEYQNLFFSILLFFSVANTINKKNIKILAIILAFSSLINLSLQIFAYFFPAVFNQYFQNILYEKYLQMYNYQANRNRFFGDSFDEVIIPIIIFLYLETKNLVEKASSILIVGMITLITTISNWRTKTILFIFSLLSSLIIFIKKIKVQVFVIIAICLFIILGGSLIAQKISGFSVVDRFFNQENTYFDTNTFQSRLIYWQTAVEMGLGRPIFGIGLGNYFDNLSQQAKLKNMNTIITRDFIVIDDPHNIFFSIFACSGFVGLFSFCFLIIYFIKSDIKAAKRKNTMLNCFITSFWALFIFSCLNPYLVFSYLCFLFLLRGVIEGLNCYNT